MVMGDDILVCTTLWASLENTESWGITKDAKRQFLCDSIYVKNRDESRAEGTRGRFWRMRCRGGGRFLPSTHGTSSSRGEHSLEMDSGDSCTRWLGLVMLNRERKLGHLYLTNTLQQ